MAKNLNAYKTVVNVRYQCRFGCSRADNSFAELSVARKYCKTRPMCVGCSFEKEHASQPVYLVRRILRETYLKY